MRYLRHIAVQNGLHNLIGTSVRLPVNLHTFIYYLYIPSLSYALITLITRISLHIYIYLNIISSTRITLYMYICMYISLKGHTKVISARS